MIEDLSGQPLPQLRGPRKIMKNGGAMPGDPSVAKAS